MSGNQLLESHLCFFRYFVFMYLWMFTPERRIGGGTFFYGKISLPLLQHSHLPCLVSGAVRQYGPGRLFVLTSQRLPCSLRQLSKHQRRPVGDGAQHPPGPAGEQRGPQRGTVPMSTPPVGTSLLPQRCPACVISRETVLAKVFSPLLKARLVAEGWKCCRLPGIR